MNDINIENIKIDNNFSETKYNYDNSGKYIYIYICKIFIYIKKYIIKI